MAQGRAGISDSGRIRGAGLRRILAVVVGGVAIPAVLSACALPPALSLASLAADGLSYVATKKSVQDHALSAAVGEDCALWRVVAGMAVCRANEAESVAAEVAVPDEAPQTSPSGDIQVAQLSLPPVAPLGTSAGPVASDAGKSMPAAEAEPAPAPAPAPAIAVEAIPAAPPAAGAMLAAKPSPSGVYVVLASYGDAPRAEAAARAHGQWGARVLEGVAAGRPVHRVVAGPYSPQAATDARRAARASGSSEAWLLAL